MGFLKNTTLGRGWLSFMRLSPQASSLSYAFNAGSLLAAVLVLQIATGLFLSMHYLASVDFAFDSVEHMMRDVNHGWLLRYMHANGASAFFIIVYLHVARGLWHSSYVEPRLLAWVVGVVLLVLMIITAFLGYVLVYGQMSLWGATVITSMVSAVPWIGSDIVLFLWGGFSVGGPTLSRFYSFHFLFPFILAALAGLHLVVLHRHGSGNALGVSGNTDRLPMSPYFLIKDTITIALLAGFMVAVVCFVPNAMGHSDNYTPANPLVTPASIVPEWYLLPFYAILRAVPDKLGGVLAMLGALLILLVLPWTHTARVRSGAFRPMAEASTWMLYGVFALLMELGACHVEAPFVVLGQFASVLYFAYFVLLTPLVGHLENGLADLD